MIADVTKTIDGADYTTRQFQPRELLDKASHLCRLLSSVELDFDRLMSGDFAKVGVLFLRVFGQPEAAGFAAGLLRETQVVGDVDGARKRLEFRNESDFNAWFAGGRMKDLPQVVTWVAQGNFGGFFGDWRTLTAAASQEAESK